MKLWINEDIFKSWTAAQRRLWDSLCAAVPFQPPVGIETWRETYLNNLTVWEAAVRKTLAQEASWVRSWVNQVAQENGAPEIMAAWVQQMEEVLQRWVQTQDQWWNEYFAVLRRGGEFMYPDRTKTKSPGINPEPVTSAPSREVEEVETASATTMASAEPPATELAPAATAQAPIAAQTKTIKPTPAASASESAGLPVMETVEDVVVEADASTLSDPAPEPTMAPAGLDSEPDDLKRIVGIGPALERKLHSQGILSYRQLATLDAVGIDQLETAIKAAGRVRRDDWIGQAKAQHFQKYQEQL